MRFSRYLVISLTAMAFGACANSTPQDDEARAMQTLGLSKVTTSSDEARQDFTDGVNELDNLHYEEAYEHFTRAIAADPNFALAELYASRAAFQTSGFTAVSAHLKRAMELSKNASEIERLEIESDNALFNGNLDDADKLAQQMVKLDPNSPRPYFQIANIYYNTDAAKTRAALDKGIEVAPQLATLYGFLSQSYTQTEPTDFVKGEQVARKAVEVAPNEPAAHDVLGDALRGQGKLEEAAQEYTKQVELGPTEGDGYQQRGHVNSFLGRYKEARADYDAAIATTKGARKFGLGAYRANVHLFEGNGKAAYDELNEMIKAIDASNPPGALDLKRNIMGSQVRIALHYGLASQLEEASRNLRELWTQQMKQVNTTDFTRQARAAIAAAEANTALGKGDFATASAKAAEVMRLQESEHSATRFQGVHALLAEIAFHQKNYQQALKEADQTSSNDRYIWYVRAKSYEALGDSANATKWFEKISTTYFNDPDIALTRGEALKKIGKVS